MKLLLGIDEAGRGCVIGPMVICGILATKEDIKKLKKSGVKDSKMLTPQKREELANVIKKIVKKVKIKVISPQQIDQENINLIEMKTQANLIKEIKPQTVYIDVPTHPAGIRNYLNQLNHILDKAEIKNIKIIGCNKADKKYEIVSAASIIAKVCRDRIIKKLKQKYGEFGSGYPSDNKTIEFVRKYKNSKQGKITAIIRKKWHLTPVAHYSNYFNDK